MVNRMGLIALLSKNSKSSENVKRILRDYMVYTVEDLTLLDELLINQPFDLFIVDSLFAGVSKLNMLIERLGNDNIVLLRDVNFNLKKLERLPLYVDTENIYSELSPYVEMLLKRRLEYKERFTAGGLDNPLEITEIRGSSGGDILHKHVIINFAKMLTANFDIDKLLIHFMDSLTEITSVNKLSIMLRKENCFLIKAQRGLAPRLIQSIRLDQNSMLVNYLSRYGRIINSSVAADNIIKMKISQEMNLLQCILSFPMAYKGRLEGIVNLGSKITGDPFLKEELEVIYILCNYLAVAIKDCNLYHQIQRQKDFINNILLNMNSGVITIDRDERICVFNQKASEVLGLSPDEMIGSDLRRLPSPMGDILYETMSKGMSYSRHEVTVGAQKTHIGINSYTLKDDGGNVVGAGMVFNDISHQLRLDHERKKAEKFKLMNIITGKIAHEIKNPLAAVQTFTQMLREKYDDREFREFYASAVLPSIRRLNNLIDKILMFSSPIDYTPEMHDINTIIEDAVMSVRKEVPAIAINYNRNINIPVYIKADSQILCKGLYYLIMTFAERLPEDGSIALETSINNDLPGIRLSLRCSDPGIINEISEEPQISVLDMDTLGIELDVSIIKKILEEHGGSLAIHRNSSNNTLIISLPVNL